MFNFLRHFDCLIFADAEVLHAESTRRRDHNRTVHHLAVQAKYAEAFASGGFRLSRRGGRDRLLGWCVEVVQQMPTRRGLMGALLVKAQPFDVGGSEDLVRR
ncbi:hypothetical protein ACNKHX_03295 [Shigella flexneri]